MTIIVVEGISAAGKTTWCRRAAPDCRLPETFPEDRHLQPALGRGTADYWTDWNAKRWADALAIERTAGQVVCDTDPLKLHYGWGLWRIGEAPQSQWLHLLRSTREAIAVQRIGFADLVLVKTIAPEIARRQMEQDSSRPRTRFELHLRLQEPLIDWYRAMERVFPGRVGWGLPANFSIRPVTANERRYDLVAFDALIDGLP